MLPYKQGHPVERCKMILYLCLGVVVSGIGLVTTFFIVRGEESIFRTIPALLFAVFGFVMVVSSLTLSGRMTEKMSAVVATTTDVNGVMLTLADGTKIACQDDQDACKGAQVGNLAVYETQRHESGLWVSKKRVTFVTRGPGQ